MVKCQRGDEMKETAAHNARLPVRVALYVLSFSAYGLFKVTVDFRYLLLGRSYLYIVTVLVIQVVLLKLVADFLNCN